MTERLYYRDGELLRFDARVVSRDPSGTRVVLDRTAFYPTSGGQPHDTGRINGTRVVDVIDESDSIVHVLDSPLAGATVQGEVDADRRRDHMQQHSAQHLLSALAQDRFGWDTVSVHFGAKHSTIEFGVPQIGEVELMELEAAANRVVAEARPVTVSVEKATVAAQRGLRKPSDRDGELRIITIEGIDRSACGGTHVSRTSEIGAIRLLDVERVRGHSRAGFIAGQRVLDHAREADGQLRTISATLECSVDEIAGLLSNRLSELKALRERLSRQDDELARHRFDDLYARTAPGDDGVRRIEFTAKDESAEQLRAMAQRAAASARCIAVLVQPNDRPVIIVAASEDSGRDANALLKQLIAPVGGRGGGSQRVAQGTVSDVSAIERLSGVLSTI